MLLAGQNWQIALLLGAISMETAAASTLMVMRECNSQGELTEVLTGIIALNNIFCLLAFSVTTALISLGAGVSGGIYAVVYPLAWQLVGAVALGFLLGLLLTYWSDHVHEQGETLILMAGSVLLCVGLARWLEVSPLIASLAVGATMVNMSGRSRRLFEALSRTDPPLYAIFFVIAGADLNLSLLRVVGPLGLIYILGRLAGKFFATSYMAGRVGVRAELRRLLGLAMFSQAGLAIGLVLVINKRFPDLAPTVTTIVLASVAVFELVGPVSARFALLESGEVRPQGSEPAVLLD
jgi:Kef-type K+ transport system membrane component KefB